MRICVLKFEHFTISVARSINCVNNTQMLSVYSLRILILVGISYSCTFLVFHEFNEMKYRAHRCINGTEIQYMLKYIMNYIVRAREVIVI